MLWPRFKEKAIRTVRTHVLLVVEEVQTQNMIKTLRGTAANEWRGEVIHGTHENLGNAL